MVVRTRRQEQEDNRITKWWCKLGLVVSWFVGFGAALGGGICLYIELRDGNAVFFSLEHTWREVLPLGLNVVGRLQREHRVLLRLLTMCIVTLLNDSMGYVHNCSLRWSLQREGKLDFNSNLRLLTSARDSRPNAWYSNLIYLTGIVVAYSSTSLIFLSLNPQLAQVLNDNYKSSSGVLGEIHINAIALIAFGVGLLAQAIITTWAFLKTDIPTWSSNPLDVARECMDEHEPNRISLRPGRCMMGVHQAGEPAQNCYPRQKQRRMFTAHHTVRWVFFLLWTLPLLGGLWGGIIYVVILKGNNHGVLGRSWTFLPVFTGYTDSHCPASACTDGTSILNIGWTASNGAPGTLGSIALVTAFQAVVTVSLHCAELIVNLSRDEVLYRKLIGPKGTNGHYNSIIAACTSWQTIVLFVFKAGVHWMFGLAINLSFRLGVNMYPPQIFYFAGFSFLVALFGTYLAFRRPRGYLPAAYGHIQTMADIIDEWADSGCMFWGQKADGFQSGLSFAGTSTRWLKEPSEDRLYGGALLLTPTQLEYQLGYQAGSAQNLPSPERNYSRGHKEIRTISRQSYRSQECASPYGHRNTSGSDGTVPLMSMRF
jgi:hypothetical protein